MAAATLTARLVVEPGGSPAASVARVELTNEGAEVVVLDGIALRVPSLALSIRDENNEPVLLPPPPVPAGGREEVRIEPGGTHRLAFTGYLPAWTRPGRYQVRFRALSVGPGGVGSEVVQSEWAALVVGE